MSRLIVKGLPKYYSEEKLRDHFSKHGHVTDVKLMKKRNGESRRFAFIGYKGDEEAEQAARFFNKSFIDTARIEVELAKTFSDPTVPLSFKMKKKMKDQSLNEQEQRLLEIEEQHKNKKRKVRSKIDEDIEKNPKLREFIAATRPSQQSRSWANDDLADGSGAPSAIELEKALFKGGETDFEGMGNGKLAQAEQAAPEDSDDEYSNFGVTARNSEEQHAEEEEEEMIPLDVIASEGDTQPVSNENMSDLDWLKLRRRRMKENEDTKEDIESANSGPGQVEMKDKASTETLEEDSEKPVKSEELENPETSEEDKIIAKISDTGRLFIRNILYTSSEEDFRALFSNYGDVEEVHIAVDTRTGKSKGFVYIQFTKPSNAVDAFKSLDKQIFQGRLLHILPADKKKDHRLDEFDLKNLPLKKQKELKRKAAAAKTQFSWNSLYMNSDAVLESVASKLGISKSQIIDAQSSNSAVKQALAEAHVIGDVRKYFESKGVDLASFDKKERDDTIVLIKNFPFGTTITELGDLFSEYGQLNRMLMPPAGTIAIIEFRDAPSARAAFTKLAYKRFKKGILYLEKGPKNLFTRQPTKDEVFESTESNENVVEAKISAADVLGDESKVADDDNDDNNDTENVVEGPTVSIFVKNLNFSTTSEGLTNAFKSLPGFVVAVVKTKPDPKSSGASLSMGFGFVEFKAFNQANAAIKAMDGFVLDGHKLILKLSHRQSASASANGSGKSSRSSKIIIKNLPFEATRKDIIELFGSFGHIKSARVPKKFDKSARGFAFVEFNLAKEAEAAMKQLEGVHLLGRRLVMQYAEQASADADAEIEKMTRKVRKQVATQQLAAARLAGKGKNVDIDEEAHDDFDDFN